MVLKDPHRADLPHANLKLTRAHGYPYRRPPTSFIYVNGNAHPFVNSLWSGQSPKSLASLEVAAEPWIVDPASTDNGVTNGSASAAAAATIPLWRLLEQSGVPTGALEQERVPVLAIGSNAGVEQLRRKFPEDSFPSCVIPVVQCVLEDHDVVYAPLMASYGSMTATLDRSPGTHVSLYATWLDPQQLARMHATEGAYHLAEVSGVRLREGAGLGEAGTRTADTLWSYVHQKGTLHLPVSPSATPSPIALSEIQAMNRSFPSLPQSIMLALVKDSYAATKKKGIVAAVVEAAAVASLAAAAGGNSLDSVDEFILDAIEDSDARKGLVAWLVSLAQPPTFLECKVLEQLGDIHTDHVGFA